LNFLLPLAWAYLETGDSVAAQDAADKASAEAARQRSPVARVEALRIQGVIASRQGRWEAAEGFFRRALKDAREISYSWGEARALYGLGLMYSRKDESARARDYLGRARESFDRLGAGAYLERAMRAMEALDAPDASTV
jgi:tetratricopeptide (TPR) repeat protein